jgi:hypothetical protein
MKRTSAVLLFTLLAGASVPVFAQPFLGTNAPGTGSNYTFTVGAGATNLSLVVSNNSTAYSYLLLKKGGTPTDTVFDFAARLNGQTNEINLESPEYTGTNYGLRVSTPATSTAQAFRVVLTTNRTDLRSAGYPVIKPLVFSTTGVLTNSGPGAWDYYQVDVPSNLLTGWRMVLSTNTPGGNPDLYVRRNALPTTGAYDKISFNQAIDTIIFTSAEATNSTYFIGVYLGATTNAHYTLSAELASITTLTWDPGTADAGTQVFTNQSASGGDYYFAINTLGTANGVWRTALNVQSGEADLYLQFGSLPTTVSYSYASTRVGSDGFVLAQSSQFSPGQNWFLLVHSTPGSQWKLVTGEAYVQPLPPLAVDASSGTNATIGPEGMRFFKTTITSNTLAWRLGLNGLTNQLYVKTNGAPVPYSTSTYDVTEPGQMLIVPGYLAVNGQYFVGVVGDPGLSFTLDSRQQPITPLAFNSTTNFSVTNYGYITFVVQVPVQQIAWQLNLTESSGEASVAVRQNNVPNEFVNDAFSEVTGPAADSITLVPPTLANGTFYVTVYGTGPYTVSLVNGQPVITDVDYVFSITNDAPTRAGWRFYRAANTAEQLGTLGWDLELSNQVAGTEIAIRRNAVPGSWNYRNNYAGGSSFSTVNQVDFSSTLGFLQQPDHQADIWYIGVYTPAAALGNFILSGSQLGGVPTPIDGAGGSVSVTNQPAGKFRYFSFTVPAGPLGWDIRITNTTSGSPQLVVCRDQLPLSLTSQTPGGGFWGAANSTNWPSGNQWGPGYDWTGDYYDANGVVRFGQVLQMGMGNPLQPGLYYVGVLNSGGITPMSYTLVSRLIGNSYTIPVGSLSFSNGVVSNPGLLGREVAYYSVVVPTNLPSWRLELSNNVGETLLMLQKDFLPNIAAGGAPAYNVSGGREMQKTGNEQYLMLPPPSQSNLVAGTYYVAVASEGMNPSGGYLGTNSSSYTLTSFGVLGVANIGTVDATGATDILVTNSSEAGQLAAFQFVVPTNTLGLQVSLENRVGNPTMLLRADNQFPGGSDTYGVDGGQGPTWANANLINLINPAPTNYTLMVQAIVSGGNAGYRVRLHAQGAQPVNFNGGSFSVTNQTAGTWQFFSVTVPSNALGWDLRITKTTSGAPQLVVCRDVAPSSLSTITPQGYGWYPNSSTNWPSGYQWGAGYDWTGDYYDANGVVRYGQVLQMGMGNPLEPGNYIVGVINSSGSTPMTYTLASRGIGSSFSIPVGTLTFTNGVVSNPSLAGREVAYYSIVVPTNLPSWRLELSNNVGDCLLMLEKDYLPNINAGGYAPYYPYGGRKMQKPGSEQYLMLAPNLQSNIIAGTYYIAVASEGMNPTNGYLGTNFSSYTLTSFGMLTVSNIGTVDPSGLTDILVTNASEAGQIPAFSFVVPPNTLSLQASLENRVGSPMMLLRADNQLTGGSDSYGVDGGQSYTWSGPTLINIANPAVTNYTLMVQAIYTGGDASYRIRLHAQGPQPLSFDGGSYVVTNQAAGTWQFFSITVPSNAFGWDVRITNTTSGSPGLVACRDLTPSSLSTITPQGYGWYPNNSTNWPTGYQWSPGYDWTGDYYDANGAVRYDQVLQMGMGNPLEPGNYIIGVINTGGSSPMSYSLASRGIGSGFSIPITVCAFTNGSSTNLSLLGREAAYFSVVVPTNTPSWKMRLTTVSGESMMAVQRGFLPNILANGLPAYSLNGGRLLQKDGNEQYVMLPPSGQSNIVSGTYYVLVGSQGVNPSYQYLGSNSSSFVLSSLGVQGVTNLGTVGGPDLLSTNNLQGGENAFYQFTIPNGSSAVEVRLDNVTGGPFMTLQTGTGLPTPFNSYGFDGGVPYGWYASTLITLPNPTPTNYSLTVQASTLSGGYPNAIDTVHIRQMPTSTLVFDSSLNGGGASNVVTGSLLGGQSVFYQVTVPTNINGQAVFGWRLDISTSAGSANIRVRRGAVPDDYDPYDGTSPFVTGEAIIVPPYLAPGSWYVEIRGTGLTTYTLTSSNLQLKRPAWAMPVQGNPVTTPGLPSTGPLFGDTGVDTNGVALPGDQGTDLAQGTFDYYTVTVPPGNIGVMRTRLDAISGNPNLYIRVGGPSTLSHNSTGIYGSTLYDRNLSSTGGSQYGNWVPVNGRYEAYLTNGTWYFAVQAAGGSNVRYRLRLYSGIVTNLSLNGGSYTGQTLAAGDWLYYSVSIPTNAPTNWNVTFSEQLGNVVMYVRDRVPPGNGTSTTDYRDWVSDYKNHTSLYASYDPAGTYSLTTPPLRPGNTYYLGFRAVIDSTFSVSCNTNPGTIDYTNTVPFYAGAFSNTVPAHGFLKLAIDVPADARRLIINFTNSSALNLYLDQGSVPIQDGTDPFYSTSTANPVVNQALYNAAGWPWQANYRYFLFATNTSASSLPFVFNVNGLNCATDDADADGLPDCWELTYWSSIYSYGPNDDPDGDGVRNLDEYLEGTDPTNPQSFHPRLQVNVQNGSVAISPPGNPTTTPPKVWYNLGQMVQLTAAPSNNYVFLGWSGDASGTANPLSITMNGHMNIIPVFGITNQPTADYQFQNNLHSSVGNPPDLTNIAAGNSFVTDIVDGFPQTVYRFPQDSSVALTPANGVIPTNIYTIAMLFSFDNVSGWRRILDVKNPPSDYGLYALNGQLNFFPTGASGPSNIVASNYVQVVMTRDASSNVVAYLNGVQQFSFVDNANYATLAGSPQLLRFFKDDTTEDSSGTVARIRLYDKVMPAAQVATLDREISGPAALKFVRPFYYSNRVMYLTLQVTPNVTYTIQASTNLINWVDITNVTSPNPLVLISDPQTANFPRRMYRGVTQVSSTVAAPTVITQPASNVGVNTATLNASINPNGASTSYYFQYGLTAGYGSFSPTNSLSAGFSPVGVNAAVAGLLQNTNYHFRAVATNSSGPTLGSDMTFSTLKIPAITGFTNQANHQLSMRFTGTSNATYSVETSTNLTSWTFLSNITMNASGTFQFVETNTATAARRFYRLSFP